MGGTGLRRPRRARAADAGQPDGARDQATGAASRRRADRGAAGGQRRPDGGRCARRVARDPFADVGGLDGAGSDQPGRRWSRPIRIARAQLGRLTVADVDRWHARLRAQGVGESSLRNQHLVLRAALSQAARWGWVSTNVAALATLGRRTVAPRSAMSAVEVRAVIEAAGRLDPAAGVAFRLAAITGARRAELCCTRLCRPRRRPPHDRLEHRHRARPARLLTDRCPRSSTRRPRPATGGSSALDPQTVAAIEALLVAQRVVGPVAADAVRAATEPGAADELVAPGPPGRRPRPTVAAPRPAPLVRDRGHRPRPRHPHRRRPPGPRQPGHDPADVCARAGRRRRRRGGDVGERPGRGHR